MFQGLRWPFKHIFALLTIPKRDLIEFEKAMFQGLSCHFEIIFGELGDVEKTMFQSFEWHSQLIFGLWTS